MSLKIGNRLKIARQYRGFTQAELADKLNITKQSLSNYENDKIELDFNRISEFAKNLEFPSKFFTQTTELSNNKTIYFRRLKSVTVSDQETQKIKTGFLCDIYSFLINYVEFPTLNIKHYKLSNTFKPEDVAKSIRTHWGLGNKPILNLKRVLESNGIPVVSLKSNKKIDAYSIKQDEYCMIILNEQQSESRALFDMAHELGHILMHPWDDNLAGLSDNEFDCREREANEFASSFLIPDSLFLTDISKFNPSKLQSFVELKKIWKVSIQALIFRAKSMGIIDLETATKLYKQMNTYKWKIWEPLDTEFVIKDTLFSQSIELLLDEYSPDFIVDGIAEQGLSLYPSDIEDLLGLTTNILSTKKSSLVTLKN